MKKISALMLLAIATSASAHLMFPAKTDDGYSIKFWADDHWDKPLPKDVIGLHAYSGDKMGKVGYNYSTGKIAVPEGKNIGMMTSEYNFGYFTFTADQHFHKPRTEVQGEIYDTRLIYKLGKGIFSWDDAYSKPVGMKVEVTPLSNPLELKVGDTLKVLVTMDGKPYSHASFEDQVGDLDDIKTNEDGIAEITLRKPQDGYQIIGASVKLPYQLQDNKAETLQVTGTLGFKAAE